MKYAFAYALMQIHNYPKPGKKYFKYNSFHSKTLVNSLCNSLSCVIFWLGWSRRFLAARGRTLWRWGTSWSIWAASLRNWSRTLGVLRRLSKVRASLRANRLSTCNSCWSILVSASSFLFFMPMIRCLKCFFKVALLKNVFFFI